ncbi:hypothetical protein [Cyclobacterium sp.]|uniref:hypothetical protein n=1 Tax=Cyclobacterium sp. TaxID=1966343 RepID=UPI0019ADD903|nr:hypothetical protein [Cyclobacterium sp.]MBD3629694.1 hypothetical protein [Cyclobacterium sp.]
MFCSYRFFPVLIYVVLAVACEPGVKDNDLGFQLLVQDTLSIDFEGEIHAGDFRENQGIIYNYRSGEYLKFDSTGRELTRNSLPAEGENGLFYVNSIKILDSGEVLAQSIKGEIGLLDRELRLKEKMFMPFPNGAMDLKRNVSTIEKWNNNLLLFYPGRGNKSPYTLGYYRDNYLLEKLDLNTGKSSPFLKLSPESQYQKDLYFEPPLALISALGDQLYFAFNKEPLIHRYNLRNDGDWQASIPLDPDQFIQIKGQKLPLGNDGTVLAEGEITGLYALDNGFAVTYFEGLENIPNQQLAKPPGQRLKIYNNKTGWASPVALPAELLFMLNFEGPDRPFYAIVNPIYTGPLKNQIKILKLHLQ